MTSRDEQVSLPFADCVRRPKVPPESPTLGLSHLQFEAMLTTARDSTNLYDFALVTMLGLHGLRILEATGSSVGGPQRQPRAPSTGRPRQGRQSGPDVTPAAVARAIDGATADRSEGPILLSRTGNRTDR